MSGGLRIQLKGVGTVSRPRWVKGERNRGQELLLRQDSSLERDRDITRTLSTH